MKIEIQLPNVGRARLSTTVILCLAADTLWYWAAAEGLAGMRPTWRILVAGIIPWGIGWVTLLLMERRIARDLVKPDRRPLPDHDREALEREVLPR